VVGGDALADDQIAAKQALTFQLGFSSNNLGTYLRWTHVIWTLSQKERQLSKENVQVHRIGDEARERFLTALLEATKRTNLFLPGARRAERAMWRRVRLGGGLFPQGLPDGMTTDEMIDLLKKEKPQQGASLEWFRALCRARRDSQSVGLLKAAPKQTWLDMELPPPLEHTIRQRLCLPSGEHNRDQAEDQSVPDLLLQDVLPAELKRLAAIAVAYPTIDDLKRQEWLDLFELPDDLARGCRSPLGEMGVWKFLKNLKFPHKNTLSKVHQWCKESKSKTVGDLREKVKDVSKLKLSPEMYELMDHQLFGACRSKDTTGIQSYLRSLQQRRPAWAAALGRFQARVQECRNVQTLREKLGTLALPGAVGGMLALDLARFPEGTAAASEMLDTCETYNPGFKTELGSLRKQVTAANIDTVKELQAAIVSGVIHSVVKPEGFIREDAQTMELVSDKKRWEENLESLRVRLEAGGIVTVRQLRQVRDLRLQRGLERAVRRKLHPKGMPDWMPVESLIPQLTIDDSAETREKVAKLRAALLANDRRVRTVGELREVTEQKGGLRQFGCPDDVECVVLRELGTTRLSNATSVGFFITQIVNRHCADENMQEALGDLRATLSVNVWRVKTVGQLREAAAETRQALFPSVQGDVWDELKQYALNREPNREAISNKHIWQAMGYRASESELKAPRTRLQRMKLSTLGQLQQLHSYPDPHRVVAVPVEKLAAEPGSRPSVPTVVCASRVHRLGDPADKCRCCGQARGGVTHVIRSLCRQEQHEAHLVLLCLWNGPSEDFSVAQREARIAMAKEQPASGSVRVIMIDVNDYVSGVWLGNRLAALYQLMFILFAQLSTTTQASLLFNLDASDCLHNHAIETMLLGAKEAEEKSSNGRLYYLVAPYTAFFAESAGSWKPAEHKKGLKTVSSSMVWSREAVLYVLRCGFGAVTKRYIGTPSEDVALREVLYFVGVLCFVCGKLPDGCPDQFHKTRWPHERIFGQVCEGRCPTHKPSVSGSTWPGAADKLTGPGQAGRFENPTGFIDPPQTADPYAPGSLIQTHKRVAVGGSVPLPASSSMPEEPHPRQRSRKPIWVVHKIQRNVDLCQLAREARERIIWARQRIYAVSRVYRKASRAFRNKLVGRNFYVTGGVRSQRAPMTYADAARAPKWYLQTLLGFLRHVCQALSKPADKGQSESRWVPAVMLWREPVSRKRTRGHPPGQTKKKKTKTKGKTRKKQTGAAKGNQGKPNQTRDRAARAVQTTPTRRSQRKRNVQNWASLHKRGGAAKRRRTARAPRRVQPKTSKQTQKADKDEVGKLEQLRVAVVLVRIPLGVDCGQQGLAKAREKVLIRPVCRLTQGTTTLRGECLPEGKYSEDKFLAARRRRRDQPQGKQTYAKPPEVLEVLKTHFRETDSYLYTDGVHGPSEQREQFAWSYDMDLAALSEFVKKKPTLKDLCEQLRDQKLGQVAVAITDSEQFSGEMQFACRSANGRGIHLPSVVPDMRDHYDDGENLPEAVDPLVRETVRNTCSARSHCSRGTVARLHSKVDIQVNTVPRLLLRLKHHSPRGKDDPCVHKGHGLEVTMQSTTTEFRSGRKMPCKHCNRRHTQTLFDVRGHTAKPVRAQKRGLELLKTPPPVTKDSVSKGPMRERTASEVKRMVENSSELRDDAEFAVHEIQQILNRRSRQEQVLYRRLLKNSQYSILQELVETDDGQEEQAAQERGHTPGLCDECRRASPHLGNCCGPRACQGRTATNPREDVEGGEEGQQKPVVTNRPSGGDAESRRPGGKDEGSPRPQPISAHNQAMQLDSRRTKNRLRKRPRCEVVRACDHILGKSKTWDLLRLHDLVTGSTLAPAGAEQLEADQIGSVWQFHAASEEQLDSLGIRGAEIEAVMESGRFFRPFLEPIQGSAALPDGVHCLLHWVLLPKDRPVRAGAPNLAQLEEDTWSKCIADRSLSQRTRDQFQAILQNLQRSRAVPHKVEDGAQFALRDVEWGHVQPTLVANARFVKAALFVQEVLREQLLPRMIRLVRETYQPDGPVDDAVLRTWRDLHGALEGAANRVSRQPEPGRGGFFGGVGIDLGHLHKVVRGMVERNARTSDQKLGLLVHVLCDIAKGSKNKLVVFLLVELWALRDTHEKDKPPITAQPVPLEEGSRTFPAGPGFLHSPGEGIVEVIKFEGTVNARKCWETVRWLLDRWCQTVGAQGTVAGRVKDWLGNTEEAKLEKQYADVQSALGGLGSAVQKLLYTEQGVAAAVPARSGHKSGPMPQPSRRGKVNCDAQAENATNPPDVTVVIKFDGLGTPDERDQARDAYAGLVTMDEHSGPAADPAHEPTRDSNLKLTMQQVEKDTQPMEGSITLGDDEAAAARCALAHCGPKVHAVAVLKQQPSGPRYQDISKAIKRLLGHAIRPYAFARQRALATAHKPVSPKAIEEIEKVSKDGTLFDDVRTILAGTSVDLLIDHFPKVAVDACDCSASQQCNGRCPCRRRPGGDSRCNQKCGCAKYTWCNNFADTGQRTRTKANHKKDERATKAARSRQRNLWLDCGESLAKAARSRVPEVPAEKSLQRQSDNAEKLYGEIIRPIFEYQKLNSRRFATYQQARQRAQAVAEQEKGETEQARKKRRTTAKDAVSIPLSSAQSPSAMSAQPPATGPRAASERPMNEAAAEQSRHNMNQCLSGFLEGLHKGQVAQLCRLYIQGPTKGHETRMRGGVKKSTISACARLGEEQVMVWTPVTGESIKKHGSKIHLHYTATSAALLTADGECWNSDHGRPHHAIKGPFVGIRFAESCSLPAALFRKETARPEIQQGQQTAGGSRPRGRDKEKDGRVASETTGPGPPPPLPQSEGRAANDDKEEELPPAQLPEQREADIHGSTLELSFPRPFRQVKRPVGCRSDGGVRWNHGGLQLLGGKISWTPSGAKLHIAREPVPLTVPDRRSKAIRAWRHQESGPKRRVAEEKPSPQRKALVTGCCHDDGEPPRARCRGSHADCDQSPENCSLITQELRTSIETGKNAEGGEELGPAGVLRLLRGMRRTLENHRRYRRFKRQPWRFDARRDPPFMAHLDAQRMSKEIRVQRSSQRRPANICGKGRWVFSFDPGLGRYVTILNVNTGDLYIIGSRAWASVKGKYLNKAREIQSTLDKGIEDRPEVKEAKAALEQALQQNNLDEIAIQQRRLLECKVRARADHDPEQLKRKRKLEAKARARFDSLIKVTARFLSAVGPRGIVCFPTDLCKKQFMTSAKISSATKGGIQFSRFGQLLQQTKRGCKRTGATVWKVREAQSSSWCTGCAAYCGYLRLRQRTFKCPNERCLLHVDRDGGAARSIFVLAVLQRAKNKQWPLHGCSGPTNPRPAAPDRSAAAYSDLF
jgi:hypothetical protein